ncbi:MAG: HAMP domain-containing protein [Planctomycetes bacterium]|nr:HAMP domain-containing protein [Planctomycetota bacterium]MBT7104635.1 HAMP domain-containing protein [Planctomycetota bacterium]
MTRLRLPSHQFWNLRVKLVLLLAFLLAGTLTVQGWLEERKVQRLLEAVEQIAANIAADAVKMGIQATAANPLYQRDIHVGFETNMLIPGMRELQLDRRTDKLLARLKSRVLAMESASTEELDEDLLLRSGVEDLVLALMQKSHPDLAIDVSQFESTDSERNATVLFEFGAEFNGDQYEWPELIESGSTENSEDRELAWRETRVAKSKLNDSAEKMISEQDRAGGGQQHSESDRFVAIVQNTGGLPPMGANPQRREMPFNGIRQPAAPAYGSRSRIDSAPFANEAILVPRDPDDFRGMGIQLQPHLDELQQLVNEARYYDLSATISMFLIGLVIAWVLGARLMRPVTEVVEGMRSVASGDLSVRLTERNDPEFGLVSRQFNEMVLQIEDARGVEKGLEHRERVQSMGDLAAGVAHDIRNPLSAISLHVGRIRREFAPTDPQAREQFLGFTGDVKEEIERLNCLVTNFLQLAQPAAQESERINPGELLKDLGRLLEEEAEVHKIKLSIDIQDGLSEAIWNRIEAKSAFLNIAKNAMQAMERDGGTLKMMARSDGQWIVISFVDDGPGIEEQDLERVMLPYVTMRPGGTGLGLAISRRVAERHGGRLEISSQIGIGTEVRFLMPTEEVRGAS